MSSMSAVRTIFYFVSFNSSISIYKKCLYLVYNHVHELNTVQESYK